MRTLQLAKALSSLTDTVAKLKLPVKESKGNYQGQNFKSNYGGGYSNKEPASPKPCMVCGDLHWIRECPVIIAARKSLSSTKGENPDRTRRRGGGKGHDRDRDQSNSKSTESKSKTDKSDSGPLN